MIKIKTVTIHKYKSIESDQTFNVEDDVTVLVGMNESGKTSVLEALGKTNYFVNDNKFQFSTTHDYPRKEKKLVDKEKANPAAITVIYSISNELKQEIESDLGNGVLSSTDFYISYKYDNEGDWGIIPTNLP